MPATRSGLGACPIFVGMPRLTQQQMLSLRLHVSLVLQFIAHDLPQRRTTVPETHTQWNCMAASSRVEQRIMHTIMRHTSLSQPRTWRCTSGHLLQSARTSRTGDHQTSYGRKRSLQPLECHQSYTQSALHDKFYQRATNQKDVGILEEVARMAVS